MLPDRENLHDFCRKSRYFAANRKLHWISRLVECHSTFLGISYRNFGKENETTPTGTSRRMGTLRKDGLRIVEGGKTRNSRGKKP